MWLRCGAGTIKVRWKCGVLSTAVHRKCGSVWFESYAVCCSAVQYGLVQCGVVPCISTIVLAHTWNVTSSSRNACFWQQWGVMRCGTLQFGTLKFAKVCCGTLTSSTYAIKSAEEVRFRYCYGAVLLRYGALTFYWRLPYIVYLLTLHSFTSCNVSNILCKFSNIFTPAHVSSAFHLKASLGCTWINLQAWVDGTGVGSGWSDDDHLHPLSPAVFGSMEHIVYSF